ncbi:hypothetical protein JCM8547_006598 [Rhodosporidiobolus lusitaniae]
MLVRFISLFVATAALGAAQSTSSTPTSSAAVSASTAAIPSCALTCTISALPGTECESYGVSNITCICTSTAFQLAYYNCQQSSCSSTDLASAEAYGAQVCEQNGTPINITATPSGYTAGASSTGSSTANETSSSPVSSGASQTASTTASVASSSTATGSTGAPAASATGGSSGAGKNVLAGGLAVLAAVGAVAVGAW